MSTWRCRSRRRSRRATATRSRARRRGSPSSRGPSSGSSACLSPLRSSSELGHRDNAAAPIRDAQRSVTCSGSVRTSARDATPRLALLGDTVLYLEAGGADAVARPVDGRPLQGAEGDPGGPVLIAAAPGAAEPELGLGRFHSESLEPRPQARPQEILKIAAG